MKLKLCWVSLAIVCLLIPHYAGAATVLDETGHIIGESWEIYSFIADQTPPVYEVTLTDFEFPAPFGYLGVNITLSSVTVARLLAPGTTTFDVILGETYLASVFAMAAGPLSAGQFNILIAPVPIPPGIILLGSSVLGLVFLRRRVR